MTLTRRFAVAAGALLAASGLQIARAQEPITLRVHHFLSAQANAHKFWIAPWAEKVTKDSGGRLKVEVYPSMQLGGKPAQLFDQSRDGVVDIAWTLAGNTPGRFPRLEVFELPFISSDTGEQTSQAIWAYYEKYAQAELKDVKVLAAFAHGRGHLFSKDRTIRTVADMKGLKIRVPSRPINDTLQNLGALPQAIPAPAVPESLAKGVVDGVAMPYEIVPALKLDELTNTIGSFDGNRTLYTIVFLFTMNKAKYDALPAELKKVIDDNSGAALSRNVGKGYDAWDKMGLEAIEKAKMKVNLITGADLDGWKSASRPVVEAWVQTRTKAGDNGAELLKAAQDLIARYAP